MVISKGDEFIGTKEFADHYYRILDSVPIIDYNRDGSERIIHYRLKVECLHALDLDNLVDSMGLFSQFRFFETTSEGLLRLVESGVIIKKEK